MLEFDVDAMPDEDITISTIPSVPVHSPGVESDKSEVSPSTVAAAPDSAEENEHVEGIPDRFAAILTTFRNWKLTLDLPCAGRARRRSRSTVCGPGRCSVSSSPSSSPISTGST